MAGIIYLKTDRFEVKLEGITFKSKDFESLCTLDFLFPDGKIWSRQPVVAFDIMRHPRDHNSILLLLCIGVGCLILRLRAGESLPKPIHKFFTDERIHFVGFGIPKNNDVFPYEELGITRRKNDIGYLAASRLNDPKYKRSELKHLARRILGIKRMIGLTNASSFERHEQIKCVICQLFITSVIGMTLLRPKDKKKLDDSPKIISFLKSFNSLPLLSEGWLKLPKLKKENKSQRMGEKCTIIDDVDMNIPNILESNNNDIQLETQDSKGYIVDDDIDTSVRIKEESPNEEFDHPQCIEGLSSGNNFTFGDFFGSPKGIKGGKYGVSLNTKGGEHFSSDDSSKDDCKTTKRPLKGILKCPSSSKGDQMGITSPALSCKEPSTSGCGSPANKEPTTSGCGSPAIKEPTTPCQLRRANSKGYNVSFAFKL